MVLHAELCKDSYSLDTHHRDQKPRIFNRIYNVLTTWMSSLRWILMLHNISFNFWYFLPEWRLKVVWLLWFMYVKTILMSLFVFSITLSGTDLIMVTYNKLLLKMVIYPTDLICLLLNILISWNLCIDLLSSGWVSDF